MKTMSDATLKMKPESLYRRGYGVLKGTEGKYVYGVQCRIYERAEDWDGEDILKFIGRELDSIYLSPIDALNDCLSKAEDDVIEVKDSVFYSPLGVRHAEKFAEMIHEEFKKDGDLALARDLGYDEKTKTFSSYIETDSYYGMNQFIDILTRHLREFISLHWKKKKERCLALARNISHVAVSWLYEIEPLRIEGVTNIMDHIHDLKKEIHDLEKKKLSLEEGVRSLEVLF